jgi:hypothetical protein
MAIFASEKNAVSKRELIENIVFRYENAVLGSFNIAKPVLNDAGSVQNRNNMCQKAAKFFRNDVNGSRSRFFSRPIT